MGANRPWRFAVKNQNRGRTVRPVEIFPILVNQRVQSEREHSLAIHCLWRESCEPRTRQNNYRDLGCTNYCEKASIRVQYELVDVE